MIEKSEIIVSGVITEEFETEITIVDEIIEESRSKQLCYRCNANKTIKVEVLMTLKGKPLNESILIPFEINNNTSHPFQINDTVILFLNEITNQNYFCVADSRIVTGQQTLSSYIKFINKFVEILKQPISDQKLLFLDWIIDLACDTELTWEGTSVLIHSHDSIFNDVTKVRLTETLLNRYYFTDKDIDLLSLVTDFGFNQAVIDYCLRNLKTVLNEDSNYARSSKLLHLMNSVYSMNKKKECFNLYLEFIDTLQSNKPPEKKEEIRKRIIADFIDEAQKP
jgi:hypothetical protein